MRVRHLNDFEIQGLLERRATASESDIPGERYLQDLDAQEHLDNCPTCLAEVALYRRLFGELEESDDVVLPKNFASKVTFSLPPFRAHRTRARLRIAAIWAGAALLTIAWFLSKLNWPGIIGKLSLTVTPKLVAVKSWLTTVADAVPWLSFDPARFWKPVTDLLEGVEQGLATDGSAVSFIVLAAVVLTAIASLDRLYFKGMRREREPR